MTTPKKHNDSGFDPRDDVEAGFNIAAQIVRIMAETGAPDWRKYLRIEQAMGMAEVHPLIVHVLAGCGMQAVLLADRLKRYEPVILVDSLRIDPEHVDE